MGTISRLTTWSTGDTLTAAAINAEFDNILSTANGSLNADNLGVTAGQASASKAIVLDSNKDFANATGSNQIRNMTLSGSLKIGTTFLPDASGGADLGSTSLEWGDVYVADDKYLYMGSGQDIKIGYDETTTDSLAISAAEGAGLAVTLRADEGDDAGDEWKLLVADGGTITLGNDIASAGTFVTHLTLTPHATVSSSTLALAGALTVAGTAGITGVATVGGITIGSAVIGETELETIDGITAGTALASKALVLDSDKDIGTIRNITIDGTFSDGNYTFDTSGNVSGLGTVASATITATDTTAPLVLKYDAGEYVTHAVSSAGVYSITTTDASSDSGAVTIDTVDSITLDSDTATEGVVYADGGTNLLRISNSSNDVVIKPLVDAKDIIFQQYDETEVLKIDDDGSVKISGGYGSTGVTVSGAGVLQANGAITSDGAVTGATLAGTISTATQNSITSASSLATVGTITSGTWSGVIDGSATMTLGSDATGDIYYRDASGFLERLAASTDGYVLTATGAGSIPAWEALASGGDFSGPGSSTNNAVIRFDGTGGKTGQNSGVTIDDSNNVTGFATLATSGAATLASLVCTAAGTFGGGYGDTGATISTTGVGQFNGALTTDGVFTAASLDISGDADIDGTLEADAITIGDTAIGSIYGVIAGSSSIATVGTIGTGTWEGDVIASAYLDADTAHLGTTQTFSGTKTFSAAVSLADGSASAPALTNTGDTNTGIFYAAADTIGFATGGSERWRITSTGQLTPNDGALGDIEYIRIYTGTNAYINAKIHAVSNTTSDAHATNGDIRVHQEQTADDNYRAFCYTQGGSNAQTFRVMGDGNVENINNSYGSISDIKLKQNITDARSYWDNFKALRFKKFRFKSDVAADANAPYRFGLIAQDVEAIFPSLVKNNADLNLDGTVAGTTTKSVKHSIVAQIGLKVVQELQARLEAAEATIAALEAA